MKKALKECGLKLLKELQAFSFVWAINNIPSFRKAFNSVILQHSSTYLPEGHKLTVDKFKEMISTDN